MTAATAEPTALPWHARPLAVLCGDAGLHHWSWLTCALLLLKVGSVAPVTTPLVALALVSTAALTTLA